MASAVEIPTIPSFPKNNSMIWRYHPPPQNGHLNYSVQDPHLPSSLRTPAHAERSYVILRLWTDNYTQRPPPSVYARSLSILSANIYC